MKFSEYIIINHIRTTKLNTNTYIVNNLDSLLEEYNAYLQEEQNKPITGEFLIELGFEKWKNTDIFFIENEKLEYELNIELSNNNCSLIYDSEIFIPYPKTKKDVLDLMRLLELN